jgi:hypothetical protein
MIPDGRNLMWDITHISTIVVNGNAEKPLINNI